MKILVTGATGFIGAAFVRCARERGHEVGALARHEQRDEEGLRWFKGNLQNPPWKEIEVFAPDRCLHGAWIAEPGVYLDSPLNEGYRRWSLQFITKLAELNVPHAMGLGTCIEYRVDGKPARENQTPLEPLSPYARAKDALRRAVEQDLPDLPFAWGRVFYPYGPGEHRARLCSALAGKLRAGERLELKTPDSTKDYIFIDDLAEAILGVIEHDVRGPVNLGTGRGVSVREIASTLGWMLKREELVANSPQQADDPFHYLVADATRLTREAKWKPRWNLEAGLRAIVEATAAR